MKITKRLLATLLAGAITITSVGFQLSYAAMAGIAFIYPRLKESWPGNPMDDGRMTKAVRWVWNSAAMSISCQITTAPLVWVHFHSFPQHFLLTNLLALPLTGLIIPVGICTVERSASTPSRFEDFTGIPMTGSVVLAASAPARCAALPAAAMIAP